MYHQHSHQQGSQPFSNGSRPPLHQQPTNQHQNMPVMGFQFPRPTQLPDELESALAIRGGRDMDHRQIDHMNRPNQHQNRGPDSGITQHGIYGPNPVPLPADNQPGQQQGVDWTSYQPPAKLFASPLPNASHQSQQHQGPQQRPQVGQTGARVPNWTPPVNDPPSPQARHPHAGGADGQSLYTPESAGSILASFGLSNEDLEVLSHYPDDQLTPDTLPFILRDIQINKSGNQKTMASTSSFSRSIHDMPLASSGSSPRRSPEVPSLLTVTQTAGKVIDYGHASRAKDESSAKETFKREQLSSERKVEMYPASSSSSSAPKVLKMERRQVCLKQAEPSKHGDRDYRRTSAEQRRSRSPARGFPPSPKSRNLDRDYRREGTKPRPSSESKSEASSRRSLSSSSISKPHGSSKKVPPPTMISDFSAVSPKVYPHTCSLCHTQCEQDKDWVEHVNTVNHTAACRDLRNKYPDWKPNLPSRSGRYGSRALWDPRDHSLSHSLSRSHSRSPTSSPPGGKHPQKPHGRPYSPHRHPRHHNYPERRHRFEHYHSGSRSPSYSRRSSSSSRERWPEKRDREPSGGFSGRGAKRPHDDFKKFGIDTSQKPPSSTMIHGAKRGPLKPFTKSFKSMMKPGAKKTQMGAKPPPPKKKKKMVTPAAPKSPIADRLVYLTGIPKDATEQDVTDLVGTFGEINNVILMPSSEQESETDQGQEASVCMVKAEDAQALATSTNLSIKDQQITALVAKKTNRPFFEKTSDEMAMVMITGLPESGWSESDITGLVQPFGTPTDIILAAQIGKALVCLPNKDVAQEMVKVLTFTPAKINDTEVKMTLLKQCVGYRTPVAVYNLLMASEDPLESLAPVGGSRLLVIRNVPETPSGPSEVQKLVRRLGTVLKTLVLKNMVICEMLTAAMALSVFKRFQAFPCSVHNHPLYFSRKPDPKNHAQTKTTPAGLNSSQDAHANGKGCKTAAAGEEERVHEDAAQAPVEKMEIDGDGKDGLDENGSKNDENAVPDSSTTQEAEPVTDSVGDVKEASAVEAVTETTEEDKGASANDNIPSGEEPKAAMPELPKAAMPELPKAAMPELPKAAMPELPKAAMTELPKAPMSDLPKAAMPELPKVTQAMVNTLLVECRRRTVSQPNAAEAPPSGEQGETQMETELGNKAAEETKEPTKNQEEEVKKQEVERKEREARKERDAKERDAKERERRQRKDWEKGERAKREREQIEKARRERERKEEERRHWERRERERRERKRVRPSSRSEGYKHSSWRDDRHNVETKTAAEEEEESGDFPFNLSDFVTVDEVGEVADLPQSPPPAVPTENSGGGEEAATTVQQDSSGDTPVEAVTPVKSDEPIPESEHVTAPSAEASDCVTLPDSTPDPVPCPQTTDLATCQPEAPEADVEPDAPLTDVVDSSTEVEPLSVLTPAASADSSSLSPAAGGVSADSQEDGHLNNDKAGEEEKGEEEKVEEEKVEVSDKQEQQEKMKDEENIEVKAAPAQPEKHERSEDNTGEESAKTKVEEDTPMKTDHSLPPFDPSNPVGMEFLVPKTGFFCKVCSRFFSGAKEAEINHCKTLKHYGNLQKYLETTKAESANIKSNSS